MKLTEVFEKIAANFYPPLRSEIRQRKLINSVCIGWSGRRHWKTFKKIFSKNPQIRNIRVLGVYYARDIAYMASLLKKMGRTLQCA